MCNNNNRSRRTNKNTLEIGKSAHSAYVPGASWNNSHTSCDILLFQYQQDDKATYAHTKFVAIVGFRLLFWFHSILYSSCYGPYEKLTQDAFMLMLLVKVVNSWESERADERTDGWTNDTAAIKFRWNIFTSLIVWLLAVVFACCCWNLSWCSWFISLSSGHIFWARYLLFSKLDEFSDPGLWIQFNEFESNDFSIQTLTYFQPKRPKTLTSIAIILNIQNLYYKYFLDEKTFQPNNAIIL